MGPNSNIPSCSWRTRPGSSPDRPYRPFSCPRQGGPTWLALAPPLYLEHQGPDRGKILPCRSCSLARLIYKRANVPHAQTPRHKVHPDHRGRTDRDRSGLRVRLFRHASLQGPEGRGLPDRAGELQPGHDHDRPGHGRRHLYRADHAGLRHQDHREGTARRAAPHHGRADRAQHRAQPASLGRARQIRGGDDRRPRRGDRQGRGPREVPRGHETHRARDAALPPCRRHRPETRRPGEVQGRGRAHHGRDGAPRGESRGACRVRAQLGGERRRAAAALCGERPDRGARSAAGHRASGHHPALLHPWRHRRGRRL